MANANALFDYIRDLEATGINGCGWEVIRLYDDLVIASGTTSTDTDPNTPLAGKLAVDETTLGYPGPVRYRVTDPLSGVTREHTSKSIGIIGPYRMLDLPYGFAMMLDGVIEGFQGELAVTGTGSVPARVNVASGVCFGHGMIYRWPVQKTINITAGGAAVRHDLLVVRFYLPGHEQEGRIDLVVRQGVEGGAAYPPIQDDVTQMLWDVPLAEIQVDPGVNVITTGKITDKRAFTIGPRLDSRYLRKDINETTTHTLTVQNEFFITTQDGSKIVLYTDLADPVKPSLELRNATSFSMLRTAGGNICFRVNGANGQLAFGHEPPNVNVHAGMGSSGRTGEILWGSDTFFEVRLNAGNSGTAAGDLASIVFMHDRPNASYGVVMTPQNSNAAGVGAYVTEKTVDGFKIFSRAAPVASGVHDWAVFVGGESA